VPHRAGNPGKKNDGRRYFNGVELYLVKNPVRIEGATLQHKSLFHRLVRFVLADGI